MRLSKAFTSVTLAASLFTDVTIAPKYIGIDPSIYLIGITLLVGMQIISLLLSRYYHQNNIFKSSFVFFIYALISLLYRYFADQAIGDFAPHILMIMNFFFLFLLLTDETRHGSFLTAVYIAGIAHFITLLPDPFGFRGNLIAATAYDLGVGGLSGDTRRETGLFPAPAMLVAFAIVFFMVTFLNFLRSQRKLQNMIVMAMPLALGLATFNRSFVVTLVFTSFALIWCTGAKSRSLILFAAGAAAVFVLPLGEYLEFVGGRFVGLYEGGVNESQRWTGSTGILTGLEVFLNHPFFGSPIAPNGGTLQALDQNGQVVNPHNGVVLILAVQGLIGGAPILILYGLSLMRTIRVLLDRRGERAALLLGRNMLQSQAFFALIFLALFPTLMAEPLPEYGFIFLLAISPLMVRSRLTAASHEFQGSSLVQAT